MPKFGPVKRPDLIYYLRQLGFDGPFSGKRHQLMQRGNDVVILPNPHEGDIGRDLLARILPRAGITREEWEKLK